MKTDPVRLRDDPASPESLRELMGQGAPPPRIDAATRAASAAAVATLAGGTAAAASATVVGGAKLWLILGGLAVTGVVAAVAITAGDETPAGVEASDPGAARAVEARDEPPARSGPSSDAPVVADPSIPDDTTEVETEAPEAVAAPRSTPRASERSPRGGRASVSADALVVEANMLERARTMLATNPAGALAQTNAHAREHPRGQLAAEREVIAIDALRRLHRPAQARRRARRLIERAPSGIYAERARDVLRELAEDDAEH